MNSALRKLLLAGGLLVLLSAAIALPKEDVEKNKEIRSPAIDNNDFPTYQDDQPLEFSLGNFFTGRVGKFFNDFLQFPAVVFRFVSGIIANQPLAKLREEVRNLNISYPKLNSAKLNTEFIYFSSRTKSGDYELQAMQRTATANLYKFISTMSTLGIDEPVSQDTKSMFGWNLFCHQLVPAFCHTLLLPGRK